MIAFTFGGLSGHASPLEICAMRQLSPAGFSYLPNSLLYCCDLPKVSTAEGDGVISAGALEGSNPSAADSLNFFIGAFTEEKGEAGHFVMPDAGAKALLNYKLDTRLSSAGRVEQMFASVDHCSCVYDNGDFSISSISDGMDSLGIAYLDFSHIVSKVSKESIRVSEPTVDFFCSIAKRIVLFEPEIKEEMLSRYAPKNFYFNSFVSFAGYVHETKEYDRKEKQFDKFGKGGIREIPTITTARKENGLGWSSDCMGIYCGSNSNMPESYERTRNNVHCGRKGSNWSADNILRNNRDNSLAPDDYNLSRGKRNPRPTQTNQIEDIYFLSFSDPTLALYRPCRSIGEI
jgi:hypothetical protein